MKAIGYNSYGDIDNLEILEVAEPRPKTVSYTHLRAHETS